MGILSEKRCLFMGNKMPDGNERETFRISASFVKTRFSQLRHFATFCVDVFLLCTTIFDSEMVLM